MINLLNIEQNLIFYSISRFNYRKKSFQKVFLEKSFEVFEIYNKFLINNNYRTNF
jgi:hypothetical protein